jgi:hypothetical protein
MRRVSEVGHWGMLLHSGSLAFLTFIMQSQAEPETIVTESGAIPHIRKLDIIVDPQLHRCSRQNHFWA